MAEREIEIIIDPDGTVHLEAFGFEGKGCHEALERLRKQLGNLKKTSKKSEYYKQKERNCHRQKG